MGVLNNLDLLSVGIAIAAIGILGFVVYFNNRNSVTNRYFLIFSLVAMAWAVVNYLSYQFSHPELVLWLLRLEIFCAVWLVVTLFLLLYVVPEERKNLPKRFGYVFLAATLVSLFNLTPLVFVRITRFVDGRVSEVQNGPGIALFGLFVVCLIITAIVMLVRKVRRARDVARKQLLSILAGIVIMFSLLVTFNFIFPAFLNNPQYIPFGGVFIFPFIVFASYAIIRHKLLNVKVISTEILVFAMLVALFMEVVISTGLPVVIFRSSVFLLVLGVGVLLIRSVIREVKQREELQRLTEQLEKVNEELRILDKARAEFITIASHQLRTPPSTIKWYVAAIMDGDFGKLSDDLRAALQRVQTANDSQVTTIDDLLNVSRLERGKMEYLFEEGDLQQVTELIVQQLEPLAIMKKMSLIYHKPEQPLPPIMMDKEKIRQVINNFIDNAIKYSKHGPITVDLIQRDGNLEVRVSDQGKGITPDEASHLFEKFTRGKDSVSHAAGLGLGLYVAKIVIEQHRGRIWAESKGPGLGSTFAFSLPVHSSIKPTQLADLTPTPKGF